MKKMMTAVMALALAGTFAGSAVAEETFVIGYAQRGTDAAYTINMMDQNLAYAEENFPELEFKTTDAQNDAVKQASDVEDLMNAGVDLLIETAKSGGCVCIYGDYDADGVTASTVMARGVSELTDNWFFYIPSRFEEGYGLQLYRY